MNASGAHIGALWQQRMDGLKEYEIVRDGNVFGAGFSNGFVYSSVHERARKYLACLLEQHDGQDINTVFPSGREFKNSNGVCFHLETHSSFHCPGFNRNRYLSEISGDLTLVRGIGKATEKKLKTRGYHTIDDLKNHPRYRAEAQRTAGLIAMGRSSEIMDLVGMRHSKTHNEILGTTALHEPEDFVFLDIETMGLFSRPIILFGIGILHHNEIVIRQYLLRDIEEEPAALMEVVECLSSANPALVTFNGKAFDAPYIADRLAYYGMAAPSCIPHYDVLHFSRRRWHDIFASLRLSVLEKEILGVRRNEDVPGQMVPEFYETYLRSGNCGPLVPIIEHNRQDVESLARLFFHLLGDRYTNC